MTESTAQNARDFVVIAFCLLVLASLLLSACAPAPVEFPDVPLCTLAAETVLYAEASTDSTPIHSYPAGTQVQVMSPLLAPPAGWLAVSVPYFTAEIQPSGFVLAKNVECE